MLVASYCEHRCLASTSSKGFCYCCPVCKEPVVLKQGRKVIHHFAHKPGSDCPYKGESEAHMRGKMDLAAYFESFAGVTADIEVALDGCRPDVVVTNPDGTQFAVELQYSHISSEDLERRSLTLMRNRLPVLWVWGVKDEQTKIDIATLTHGGLAETSISIKGVGRVLAKYSLLLPVWTGLNLVLLRRNKSTLVSVMSVKNIRSGFFGAGFGFLVNEYYWSGMEALYSELISALPGALTADKNSTFMFLNCPNADRSECFYTKDGRLHSVAGCSFEGLCACT